VRASETRPPASPGPADSQKPPESPKADPQKPTDENKGGGTPKFKDVHELISSFPKAEEDRELDKPGIGEDSPFGDAFKEIGGSSKPGGAHEKKSAPEKKEDDPRDFVKKSEPKWFETKKADSSPKGGEQVSSPAEKEQPSSQKPVNPFLMSQGEKTAPPTPSRTAPPSPSPASSSPPSSLTKSSPPSSSKPSAGASSASKPSASDENASVLEDFLLPLDKQKEGSQEDYVLDLDFIFDEKDTSGEEASKQIAPKQSAPKDAPARSDVPPSSAPAPASPDDTPKKAETPAPEASKQPANPFFTPELLSRMGVPMKGSPEEARRAKTEIGSENESLAEDNRASKDEEAGKRAGISAGAKAETPRPTAEASAEPKPGQAEGPGPGGENPFFNPTYSGSKDESSQDTKDKKEASAAKGGQDGSETGETDSRRGKLDVEKVRMALITLRQSILSALNAYKEGIKLGYRRDPAIEALLTRLIMEVKKYLSS
jgi:hypothetical protein